METDLGGGGRRTRTALGAAKRRVNLVLQHLEERFAPAGLTLLGQWENGTALYSDGWGIKQNGRDYAYIGHKNNTGIHIVDITDPAHPVLVSNFLSPSGWNDFRDVELLQRGGRRTFGYFSSDVGGGLVVANVSNPANPVEVARITSADGGTNTVHTLSIDGNYLYEADSRTSTIRVFDIKNPASPKWFRNIISATQAVHEVTALNGRLYAAGIFDNPRVEVYDISEVGDLSKPVTLLGTVLSGSRAHTAWPTEDGNFVAVAHEKQAGNLSFWNVTDPANPQLAWNMVLPANQAYSVHQVMIKGDQLYVSWYEAGIFVFDITDRFNPVLLGSYDTYLRDQYGYNGAWGVYPFLGDEKILGFDKQGGLFVLSLDDGPAPAPNSNVTPIITHTPIDESGSVYDSFHDANFEAHCAPMAAEARALRRLDGNGVASLATAAVHGAHGIGLVNLGAGGSTVVTGDHSRMLAGLPVSGSHGDSMMSGYMGMHGGGKIAPELMVRTSTTSQVGGQVAYHKPG